MKTETHDKVFFAALIVLALLAFSLKAQSPTVTLNWIDTVNPAGTTYNAYRKSGACSAAGAFAKLNTAAITAKTYSDTGVAPGTYCYHVTAFNSTFTTPESTPSPTATTEVPLVPPSGLSITVAVATVTVSPSGEMVAKLEVNAQKPTSQ